MKVYSIKDHLAGTFGKLICFVAEAMAVRFFQDGMMEDSIIARHPDHFGLYYMGEFNEQKGQFQVGEDCPKQIMPGVTAFSMLMRDRTELMEKSGALKPSMTPQQASSLLKSDMNAASKTENMRKDVGQNIIDFPVPNLSA